MKRILVALLALGLLVGCSNEETVKENEPKKETVEKKETAEKKETVEKTEVKKEEPKINTSIFQYAKKVEVTDSRETTGHVNVVVHMSEELTAPLAVQHVLTQTYDFLQQEDLKGAKTVTVGIMQGDQRPYQFNIDTTKFVTDDSIPMAKLVLDASVVEKTTPEIDEYIQEIVSQ
jgi:hypothetical protein